MVLVLVGLLLVGIVGKQVLFILSSHYIGISQRGIICPCLLFLENVQIFYGFLNSINHLSLSSDRIL